MIQSISIYYVQDSLVGSVKILTARGEILVPLSAEAIANISRIALNDANTLFNTMKALDNG